MRKKCREHGTINETTAAVGNDIGEFKRYFERIWMGDKPLAKVFRTDSRGYLYDSGTNKLIGCDDMIFHLLSKLLTMNIDRSFSEYISENGKEQLLYAANAVKNAIEKESVLRVVRAARFDLSEHYSNYKDLIDSSLEILFLEVTERCNLRCEYCVYNNNVRYKRNHGSKDMNPAVAYRAIDYLDRHSFRREKVAISIYGGEPLLRYPLIKSCVEYAGAKLKNREIDFSITTNGTLVTPDIADFFYRNNFNVFVSIDGPVDVHNGYRLDSKGNGSYKDSIRGLKNLVNAYSENSKGKINLSMVYAPPFSGKRIDRIAQLWDEEPWLPKDINIHITYPSSGTIDLTKIARSETEEDRNLRQWAFDKFKDKYIGAGDSHPIADSIMNRNLAQLMQRSIFSEDLDRYTMNGCCLPGVRRLYVSVDGNFHVCERIASDAPTIGDIHSGIDFDAIKRVYIDGYEEISLPLCSTCWAVRLCSSCYTDVFKNGTLDMETKRNHCLYVKDSQEQLLEHFCTLLELKPGGLNYLYGIELT